MNNLKLMLFDMDGVVFDSETLYFNANRNVAKKLNMSGFNLDYYQQFIGGGDGMMVEQMTQDYGSRDLIEEFMELSRQEVYSLVEMGQLAVKPGVRELVTALREHEIPAIIASSNNLSEVNFFMEHTQTTKLFDDIVTADDVEKTKPAPDVFLKAWQKGGQPNKEHTLILEDSLNGVKAANNAQIPVVMIPDYIQPNDYVKRHTVQVLENMHVLKKILQI